MPEILVTAPGYLHDDARRILERVGNVTAKALSAAELERIIDRFDAILIRADTRLSRGTLERAAKLRVIGSATTGLGHIDVEYAKAHNIKIVNLNGAHTIATAEYAMALILSLCRNIPWAFESVKRGEWERHRFIGSELEGKTLGIIGLGRIGARLAGYAVAFGMRVVAFDPYAKGMDGVEIANDVRELLKESDIVSIHSALTPETKGLLDKAAFDSMKDGACLINAARYGIVDVEAMLSALESGKLAGAAFDVLEKEPPDGDDDRLVAYARKHGNLLLTPHLGASARDAVRAASVEIAQGVADFLAGP